LFRLYFLQKLPFLVCRSNKQYLGIKSSKVTKNLQQNELFFHHLI
jgi:hypothetical protein